MAPSFTTFRDDLLLALADSAGGMQRGLDPQRIAGKKGLTYTAGWVRKAVETMERHGWVKAKYSMRGGDPDVGIVVVLDGSALEEADRLIADRQAIPAADRTVTINHNEPVYEEVLYGFKQTIEAIKGKNEYGASEPEDRGQRIAELEAGQHLLKAPRVRVEPFVQLVMSALRYLAKKFADNAVGILAAALMAALVKLLGLA